MLVISLTGTISWVLTLKSSARVQIYGRFMVDRSTRQRRRPMQIRWRRSVILGDPNVYHILFPGWPKQRDSREEFDFALV
jgi:hypothetical protein